MLSVPNHFLTLIKLRTYTTNFELSCLFGISEAEVYIVFVTWDKFMSLQWQKLNLWPSREVDDFFAPVDFREKFPNHKGNWHRNSSKSTQITSSTANHLFNVQKSKYCESTNRWFGEFCV